MSKFITFNGVTLFHPGGITKVDATGMAQVSGGASGIVGIIGEADYGEPYNPDGGSPKVYTFTDPDAAAETFKSGALADSIDFLFNPANDVRIPGGAQQVIAIKSNVDTQSTTGITTAAAVPDRSTANLSLTFTSVIYGKYANALSVKVARNEANTDTLDVTVTDGNTATVETFTQICGDQLLDVQYAPGSEGNPTVAVAELVTDVNSADPEQLPVAVVPAGCVAGRWVQITGHDGSQPQLLGQVRRINNIAGLVLHLQSPFIDDDGTALTTGVVNALTTFKVLREAVGPFFVTAYNSVTNVITVEGAQDNQPSGYIEGSPLFWVNGTGAAQIASATSGPGYLQIVSGTGEGQIRRISAATSGALGESTLTIVNGFATDPDTTSQFMFVNAVPDTGAPTFTGGNAMGEGAIGVIGGSAGVSTSLTLQVRPGFGEPATHGGAAIAAGGAGALRTPADWVFTLSADLTVNALVDAVTKGNLISGAIKGSDATAGSWNAQGGPGRDGTLPTTRFDWTGAAGATSTINGADATTGSAGVDCLCDFNTTHPVGAETGDYGSTPNRYHRFVDNLMVLVDTLNAQSVLVSAARATEVGAVAAPAGPNWGDGVPAFATYALGGGTYNPTTAGELAACFNELIKHRHDTAVALWSTDFVDPLGATVFTLDYVHSLLLQHAQNGAGSYRNEVDCIAAFQPPAAGTEAVAINLIESKAAAMNNRNVAMVFQDIKRSGLTGTTNQYEPHMLACAVAGMQAGSPIGTPLTFKVVKALEVLCNNARIDTLDKNTSDLLLQRGLLFTEKVKSKGDRVVKNLSTYTATDNVAYTDRNVNYELNYMAYDLRTFIVDTFVGAKATPAVVASVKSAVITKLEYYKTNLEIIVDSQDASTGASINAYRNIKVTISGDICTIRFEIFPAVGINYVTFEIFAKLPTLSA